MSNQTALDYAHHISEEWEPKTELERDIVRVAEALLRVEKAAEIIDNHATAATVDTRMGYEMARGYLDAYRIIMDAIRGEGEMWR